MNNKQIFISNRLPFGIDKNTQDITKNSGGLVSALLGVNLHSPFMWLGFEYDPEVADVLARKASEVQSNLILRPVVIEKNLYDEYYDKFCNDTLWPLFHYEGQHTFFQRAYWDSYIKANHLMAQEILEVADDNDDVWIHDFHFFLLPKILKEKRPQLKVGLFLHTPFPCSEIFRQLPVREELLSHVIHADLLGFHEHSYLRHFSDSLKATLGIDSSFFKASIGQHTLHLGVYPISIDSERFQGACKSTEVIEQTKRFHESINSPFLILGVDRLDYSKGLKLKLRGLKRALQKYPELRGKVSLLQVAIPTRVNVPSYINLKNEIDKLVGEINGEFGTPDYVPVSYIYNSVSEVQLIALYKRTQAMLITSKRDGMNLVAMEFSVCQDQESPGVLILSEFTGAASLLGQGLIINPWDVDSTADAIFKAYEMSYEERLERVQGLQNILNKYSASTWAETFLLELKNTFDSKNVYQRLEIKAHSESWPVCLREKFRSLKRAKLFLDYDGTLVNYKSFPHEAVLSDKTKSLVMDLASKMDVTIISGRPMEFLDEQFDNVPVHLVAEHGAFYKIQDGPWMSRLATDTGIWYPEVIRVMESYTQKVPLSFLEIKKTSVVWHYRQSPHDFAHFQAKKLDDELRACLANLPVSVSMGAKIVEAKAVECNKGEYLRSQFSATDERSFVCIGDDKTDEDMFKAIKGRGVSIKVGPGSSTSEYFLHGQEDVNPFLMELKDYYERVSQV